MPMYMRAACRRLNKTIRFRRQGEYKESALPRASTSMDLTNISPHSRRIWIVSNNAYSSAGRFVSVLLYNTVHALAHTHTYMVRRRVTEVTNHPAMKTGEEGYIRVHTRIETLSACASERGFGTKCWCYSGTMAPSVFCFRIWFCFYWVASFSDGWEFWLFCHWFGVPLALICIIKFAHSSY